MTSGTPTRRSRVLLAFTRRSCQSGLGHASITITLETYSHAIPAMQETAASLAAALVFESK